jgi:hypothetical protein
MLPLVHVSPVRCVPTLFKNPVDEGLLGLLIFAGQSVRSRRRMRLPNSARAAGLVGTACHADAKRSSFEGICTQGRAAVHAIIHTCSGEGLYAPLCLEEALNPCAGASCHCRCTAGQACGCDMQCLPGYSSCLFMRVKPLHPPCMLPSFAVKTAVAGSSSDHACIQTMVLGLQDHQLQRIMQFVRGGTAGASRSCKRLQGCGYEATLTWTAGI